jgi:serine/threonine-protein kinase
MDSPRFAQIESLFHAVLGYPPEQWHDELTSRENDTQIVAEVERLLARHAQDESLLKGALDAVTGLAVPMRTQIGAYRILGELGAGGMGTVLLAERLLGDTPQKVALKLIRGIPTASARDRLARERALLAELNHPNIARLLDAGETPDRVPYLAMEYIDGAPLLPWCETAALDLPARLRLFVQLCRAVQHAHQHLIVHRDIKPANILVRDDGTPVLLDFGIGKLIDPGAEDQTATQAFTPAYAAPEQRAGDSVTTAADIWGLGCVLYELVSGRSLRETRVGDRVTRPSEAAVDVSRRRALRGDIDTIVATALQADPALRYASAQALADDIENHLLGKPLNAAPDRVLYRARKFVIRHRFAVAAAVFALVVIAGLLWRLTVERNDALRHAQRAQVTRDFLVSLFRFADPSVHHGAPVTLHDMLAQGSVQLDTELAEQRELHAELSEALGEIYRHIGEDQSALAQFRNAVQLSDGATDTLVRARRVAAAARLTLKEGDPDKAARTLPEIDSALALVEPRGEEAARELVIGLLASRALALATMDRGEDATKALHRALELVPALATGQNAQRANLYYDLTKLDMMRRDNPAALVDATQALAEFTRAYGVQHVETVKAMQMREAVLLDGGDYAGAETQQREVLAAQKKLYPDDSPRTARTEMSLAELLLVQGRPDEAIAFFEQALPHCLAEANISMASCLRVRRGLGEAQVVLGRPEGAATVRQAAADCAPSNSHFCLVARAVVARVLCLSGDIAAGKTLLADVDRRWPGAVDSVGSLDARHLLRIHEDCAR